MLYFLSNLTADCQTQHITLYLCDSRCSVDFFSVWQQYWGGQTRVSFLVPTALLSAPFWPICGFHISSPLFVGTGDYVLVFYPSNHCNILFLSYRQLSNPHFQWLLEKYRAFTLALSTFQSHSSIVLSIKRLNNSKINNLFFFYPSHIFHTVNLTLFIIHFLLKDQILEVLPWESDSFSSFDT